ncbi:ATP-binding protein [Streptomyces sp. 6N106]|uniref:ATP-binding protein n=1 Tax=Streptomyces sp. 6N106 TaxID=3457418 RepID=UPI003FD6B850
MVADRADVITVGEAGECDRSVLRAPESGIRMLTLSVSSGTTLSPWAIDIRNQHAAEPRRATMTLPAEPCRVLEVRRFTRVQLGYWGVSGDEVDSAVLVVSELAGNAAIHGRTTMRISLQLDARLLSVEIVDFGTRPILGYPASGGADEHGRGLFMVAHLAEWVEYHETPDSYRASVGLRR